MKKTIAIAKLEKHGYTIITCMQGGYIAKKNNLTITSNTINGLINRIFK